VRGDADSAYNLGVIRNYRGDAAQTEHWWRRAADAGDDSAIFALGVTCLNRDDMSGAKTWWLAAARAGNEQAMNNIESILEDDDDEVRMFGDLRPRNPHLGSGRGWRG